VIFNKKKTFFVEMTKKHAKGTFCL